MIGARQQLNILQYIFSGNAGTPPLVSFIEPTATFTVTPTIFSLSSPPANMAVTAVITANSASNIGWEIYDGVSVSPVAAGSNLVISTTLPTPTADTTYTLRIEYIGGLGLLEKIAEVVTYNTTLIGQLPLPSDNIVLAADLTPFIAGLAVISEADALELFTITAAAIGRLVIVVPDNYGTLTDLSDENDISVLNEFNVVVDATNNRKIYVKINTVTSGSYKYKLVY